MSDFRWLIEAPGQKYLAVRRLQAGQWCEFIWSGDHNIALAFRSEEQADSLMMAVRQLQPALFGFESTLGNARAVEHGWIAEKVATLGYSTAEVAEPTMALRWRNGVLEQEWILRSGNTMRTEWRSVPQADSF